MALVHAASGFHNCQNLALSAMKEALWWLVLLNLSTLQILPFWEKIG